MSPLSALAPDQRAVLELLLRQGRSYAELSELLGLPEDGVRERAAAALEALAPDMTAPIGEGGAVADWILGQQDDDEAERTSEALARTPGWRAWAEAVTDRLAEVEGADVPEVPAAAEAAAKPAPKPKTNEPRRSGGANRPAAAGRNRQPGGGTRQNAGGNRQPAGGQGGRRPRPVREAAAAGAGAAAGAKAARRERPRPADPTPAPVAAGAGETGGSLPLRSSRLGGAILLGILALAIAALLIWLLTRGGNDNPSGAAASAKATATATATPQVVDEIPLKAVGKGNKAEGLMRVFRRTQDGKLVFALAADKVPPNNAREVYAVWFLKKGKPPLNLGFAQTQVGKQKVFTTGGPQAGKETAFAGWLGTYSTVVVARASATAAAAKRPGQIILAGTLPGAKQ